MNRIPKVVLTEFQPVVFTVDEDDVIELLIGIGPDWDDPIVVVLPVDWS
jgi:hypothetical protein